MHILFMHDSLLERPFKEHSLFITCKTLFDVQVCAKVKKIDKAISFPVIFKCISIQRAVRWFYYLILAYGQTTFFSCELHYNTQEEKKKYFDA